MDVVIYLLVICLIIYIVFSLLPIILPLILILIIAVSAYIWYMKRKIMKHMDAYEKEADNVFQDERIYRSQSRSTDDDVIDVEYTETEDHSDRY